MVGNHSAFTIGRARCWVSDVNGGDVLRLWNIKITICDPWANDPGFLMSDGSDVSICDKELELTA